MKCTYILAQNGHLKKQIKSESVKQNKSPILLYFEEYSSDRGLTTLYLLLCLSLYSKSKLLNRLAGSLILLVKSNHFRAASGRSHFLNAQKISTYPHFLNKSFFKSIHYFEKNISLMADENTASLFRLSLLRCPLLIFIKKKNHF